ncbi:ribosome silencing factor [Sinorhizobium mexicanum]|uniref:Ribosomal silencing factor RsfS n=1 Tax=Sinorhizobium mexicanum TaxID=375549 RepID=A0A859QGX8_9HYPH|nr:ribosome silencing factor [Sinorhizobium mexicanum]MBP1885699.1 ribosome-associated protein [Sinorhizobium mexicanum]QLL63494.1 ribosome silencing factor [Sinorhizobium mexicanum]
MPTFINGSILIIESEVPVLFFWKGKTLTTVHAKGYAATAYPRSTESSDEAAVRALNLVLESLEDSKAENIVTINIAGKSALGDFMVVVSGRSNRHVMAIADHLITDLKDEGFGNSRVEGLEGGDWVLIDTGDVIVHIFRPEIREFYNIEKMWAAPEIEDGTLH